MNEPMPQWRSFSSDVPDPADERPPHRDERHRPPWLLPLAVVASGLAAGVLAAAAAVLVVIGLPVDAPGAPFGEPLAIAGVPAEIDSPAVADSGIVVDVAGAVARPGLYRLLTGDRVGDAIEAAGGFGPRADLSAASLELNLAQALEDGAKVLVPELGREPLGDGSVSRDGRIDLNRASQSELESLPGIGPVTAGKIIDARSAGRFDSVRDLRTRGLVGEAVYADIRDRVATP